MTTARSQLWLQCLVEHPDPRRRLVCFPHAGGSAQFFRDWGRLLPEYEVYAVRYPGRAERIDEPLAEDLSQLARDIADAILPLAEYGVVLFGHSMGAAVALETARSLESRGIVPVHLFASGSRDAPCPPFAGADAAEIDENDAETVARLIELGGTDPELAADPVFQELVLPYIKADTRMFHAYSMGPQPVLHCPVTAIVGDADDDADLRPWSQLTDGPFRQLTVSGDHFYLLAEPPLPELRRSLDTTPAR